MMDTLVEVIVAVIILAVAAGISLIILGADPALATALIRGVAELSIYGLVIGMLVLAAIALLQQAL